MNLFTNLFSDKNNEIHNFEHITNPINEFNILEGYTKEIKNIIKINENLILSCHLNGEMIVKLKIIFRFGIFLKVNYK
jgi:hypothetical protein